MVFLGTRVPRLPQERRRDDGGKFSEEEHTTGLSARCLFPHTRDCSDTTHTGVGTVGGSSALASVEDRAFSQPLASWREMGQDQFSLLSSLGTEGTHEQTTLPPLSQEEATLATGLVPTGTVSGGGIVLVPTMTR